MKIREIMTTDLSFVRPGDTVKSAAMKMKDRNVGSMPVMDDGKALGLLTDRDIVLRTVAENRDPMNTQVADVMTKDVVFCHEDDDVKDAVRMMEERQIRRLLVMNDRDEVSGIVSLGDVAVKAKPKYAGEALSDISKPAHPAH